MSEFDPNQETIDLYKRANTIAAKNGDENITSEHVLLALIQGKSVAQEVLKECKVNEKTVRQKLQSKRVLKPDSLEIWVKAGANQTDDIAVQCNQTYLSKMKAEASEGYNKPTRILHFKQVIEE